jgi:hypothetical protein
VTVLAAALAVVLNVADHGFHDTALPGR